MAFIVNGSRVKGVSFSIARNLKWQKLIKSDRNLFQLRSSFQPLVPVYQLQTIIL